MNILLILQRMGDRQDMIDGMNPAAPDPVMGGSGCIRSLDITGGFPAAGTINNVILNATGGTGTITVDNNSGNAEASSVYYTTLSGATIVKATQSALQ